MAMVGIWGCGFAWRFFFLHLCDLDSRPDVIPYNTHLCVFFLYIDNEKLASKWGFALCMVVMTLLAITFTIEVFGGKT